MAIDDGLRRNNAQRQCIDRCWRKCTSTSRRTIYSYPLSGTLYSTQQATEVCSSLQQSSTLLVFDVAMHTPSAMGASTRVKAAWAYLLLCYVYMWIVYGDTHAENCTLDMAATAVLTKHIAVHTPLLLFASWRAAQT